MSTSTMKYFKLGKKASLFSDPKSGLKIVKGVPGAVTKGKVRGNKKIRKAEGDGHIVSISEATYDKMIKKAKKTHGKGLKDLKKPEAPAKRKEVKNKKKEDKPLDEMNLEELEMAVNALEDITEEKVEKVMEGSDEEIIEFIETYDADADAELETSDDGEEDAEEDAEEEPTPDEMRDKIIDENILSKKKAKKLDDQEVEKLYNESFPKEENTEE